MSARVVHLSSVHPPYDIRILTKECTTLAASGYQVSYVVPHDRSESIAGVTIVPFQRSGGRFSRMLVAPWRAWRAARRAEGDIYHLHDPELLPIAILLKLSGKRVIYDVHEDLHAQILSKPWIPAPARQSLGWITAAIQRFVATRVDAVVAATPHIAEGFPHCRVITVQNFPKQQELESTHGSPFNERTAAFVYLGGITRIRGAREMVEAIARVPEQYHAELWLAGTFESEQLRQELESLPGWSRTRYFGHVDRAGVKRLLTDARAGLVLLWPVPNYLESYPTKLFEYMSAGLPSIASNFDFWSSMPGLAGCARFVNPRDPDQIASTMQSILDDSGAAEKMGRNGRQLIAASLNWEREAEKLLGLYAAISQQLTQASTGRI